MQSHALAQLILLALIGTVSAQFGGFFDQMFGGGGGHQHQQQQQQQQQNVPSDSSWYRSNVDAAQCSNYLCPDTLGSSPPFVFFRFLPCPGRIRSLEHGAVRPEASPPCMHACYLVVHGAERRGRPRGRPAVRPALTTNHMLTPLFLRAACVHFPHHCPCPFPDHEDKFELADGQRICVSRGGFKAGEAARKVELARKGLL